MRPRAHALRCLIGAVLLLAPVGLFALIYVRRVRKLAVHVSGRMASWLKLDEIARVRAAQVDLLDLMDGIRWRYQKEVFGIEQ